VLDLYAGSGALGIEALSRGAGRATFVEQSPLVCRTLRENLRDLGLAGRATLLIGSVRGALHQPQLAGPFDLIFADPPYASDEPPWLLDQLMTGGKLRPGGLLVLERASRDADATVAATAELPTLTLTDRRRYGDTTLLFFAAVS
jgi:16S rRNA (guanine966-N2)-methyltransferase